VADRYGSVSELMRHHVEGVDYSIETVQRRSPIAVIAPHAGRIEPMTGEIAEAVAGDEHSYYAFRGLMTDAFATLHVTSTRFDEPRCLALLAASEIVVAVHGLAEGDTALLGGRDRTMRDSMVAELTRAGFAARAVHSGPFSATDTANICNRGGSKAGVQIELPRAVRDELRDSTEQFTTFVTAVRAAIGNPT
jgi:phage replication-related protein YjqB (UPF0714/DUF867 family)